MEPCFAEAELPPPGAFGEGLERRIRSKRGMENKAEYPNTRKKRWLFTML